MSKIVILFKKKKKIAWRIQLLAIFGFIYELLFNYRTNEVFIREIRSRFSQTLKAGVTEEKVELAAKAFLTISRKTQFIGL